jgi:hypothetical protein
MTNGLAGTHCSLPPSPPFLDHAQVTAAAFVLQVRRGDAWEGEGEEARGRKEGVSAVLLSLA